MSTDQNFRSTWLPLLCAVAFALAAAALPQWADGAVAEPAPTECTKTFCQLPPAPEPGPTDSLRRSLADLAKGFERHRSLAGLGF